MTLVLMFGLLLMNRVSSHYDGGCRMPLTQYKYRTVLTNEE